MYDALCPSAHLGLQKVHGNVDVQEHVEVVGGPLHRAVVIQEPGVDLGRRQIAEPRLVARGQRDPQEQRDVFWRSTSASARSSRDVNRRVSRSNSPSLRSRGSTGATLGPRYCGASPAIAPRSRAACHTARWELYRPSRLSTAPIAPSRVPASASRRICDYTRH